MNYYQTDVAFSAWTANNGSTLTPVADARNADFGTLLLAEFKQYARITYTNDDNILPSFVNSAIQIIEQHLELCILPRSFDWNVSDANSNFDFYEIPLRNTATVGSTYDFEFIRAKTIIPKPASFPVTLLCGFNEPADIPTDLKMLIFQCASSYELNRSATDASTVIIPPNIMARYGVMRC